MMSQEEEKEEEETVTDQTTADKILSILWPRLRSFLSGTCSGVAKVCHKLINIIITNE